MDRLQLWVSLVLVALITFSQAGFLGMVLGGLFGKKGAKEAGNRAFPDFLKFRNEILSGKGGFDEQMRAMIQDPDIQRARTNLFYKAPEAIKNLRSSLMTGALSETSGGQVAALEMARRAGATRGGLAFGGGAHSVAEAGARATAPAQASALAQALTQVTGMELDNINQQSSFALNRRAGEAAMRNLFLQGQFGLGQTALGAKSNANMAEAKYGSQMWQGIGGAAGSLFSGGGLFG